MRGLSSRRLVGPAFLLVALVVLPSCRASVPAAGSLTESGAPSIPPTIPSWVYGHWVWEDESTQESATALVDGYLEHGITVTAVIIDSPWETAYNTFEPDPSRYPDFEAMTAYFHSRGVRVICWITGVMNTDAGPLYEEARSRGYFMQKDASAAEPTSIRWWKGTGSLLDFFNPEAVEWWQRLMDRAFDLGVDGWKVDATDAYAAQAPYSPYLGRAVEPLDYSRRYYDVIYEYTRQRRGTDGMITGRPVDMNRRDTGDRTALQNSHTSLEAGWAGWVGDQVSVFDPLHYTGIKGALLNYYYSSRLGYLAFGSDIGGYIAAPGQMLNRDLLLRWTALGAFSPVMENGGIGEHRPWEYGDETADIYRRFVEIHMRLIPYLLQHAPAYYLERRSLLEFLDRDDFSYLLGPDIFVHPITEPCGCAKVRLPAEGRWTYLFDASKVYEGGSVVDLQVPVDEFPAFVRQGSALAFSLEVG